MTVNREDAFRRQLLETYFEEALEYIEEIFLGLAVLKETDVKDRPDIVENIYRKTHSLKGASRAVNFPDIVSVCQNLETLFSSILKAEILPDKDVYEAIEKALLTIKSLIVSGSDEKVSITGIIQDLKNFSAQKEPEPESFEKKTVIDDESYGGSFPAIEIPDNNLEYEDKSDEPERKKVIRFFGRTYTDSSSESTRQNPFFEPGKSTIRIATEKIDRLIQGTDDLLTIKIFFSQRINELENMLSGFEKWRWNDGQTFNEVYKIQEMTRSYDVELPEEFEISLENIRKFLDYNREFVRNLEHHLSRHVRLAEIDKSDLEASTSEITDLIHDAVLMPFNIVLMSFPEYIRDISKSLGKEVVLSIEGGNIEIDRRILDSLKDPLMHLIRNSIDHGIEEPGARISAGKPSAGEIKINIRTLSGSRVEVVVSDDGAGINTGSVKRKAVEKGIITEKKASSLSDEELIALIFRSGLTTSHMITEISGRGLGLAIVADAISHLNGEIDINSAPGKGTEFKMILPLKLATFRGVIVVSAEQRFVFPKQQVKKVISISPEDIDPNVFSQTMVVDGEKTGVIRLSEAMGIKDYSYQNMKTSNKVPVVILGYGVGQIGFIVDEILSVQEIVVRSLGTQLRHVKKISGAAVLGDGATALVIDPLELIEESLKPILRKIAKPKSTGSSAKILIVEDSVTSRQYLFNILKKSGYDSEMAQDGAEAFLKLKDSDFSLVVSDVDMPRMSGFTLTEKIRRNKRLSSVPVILVTSLDNPADKKQGELSGANAYIPKKNFSEEDFLLVIRNLLD